MVLKYLLILIVFVFCFQFFQFWQLSSFAKETALDIKDTGKTEDKAEEKEEEKSDPLLTYRLVGIYLIGKEPRALIKDLSNDQEGPKEFQIGDYLDELHTFSISKISFNPTARVELIDQNGLSYLVKPYNTDDKNTQVKSMGASRSVPTYFSSTTRSKATQGTQDTTQTSTQTTGTTTPSPQAQDTAQTQEGTQAPTQAQTQSQTQSGTTTTSLQAVTTGTSATTQTAPAPVKTEQPKPSDSLDVSRPSNPFAN
ncbi:MAG: hypothetical protein HYY52_03580 [Candidatus Melainabacteria bacterium]|nr:hypothetical protein [Candidatus Melainabacteria bacterium]